MKRKNGQFSFDASTLQWAIIAVIICIVMSWFNVWWFWWIPFVVIGGGCHRTHDETLRTDEVPVKAKRKNDERY